MGLAFEIEACVCVVFTVRCAEKVCKTFQAGKYSSHACCCPAATGIADNAPVKPKLPASPISVAAATVEAAIEVMETVPPIAVAVPGQACDYAAA